VSALAILSAPPFGAPNLTAGDLMSNIQPTPNFDPDAKRLIDIIRERKGWSDEFIKEFNNPQHDLLKDSDKMVLALRQLWQQQRKLVILPDFDMDGICAGVLSYAGFSELGFNVEMYVPDHRDGHEITEHTIAKLLASHPDTHTIITCDCGINSNKAIKLAQSQGIQVLVTDHHVEQTDDEFDHCVADLYVDPCRLDETYFNKTICGAYVIYQVIHSYTRLYEPMKLPDIEFLRVFAGIATVSDVMELKYENRMLIRDAISMCKMAIPENTPPNLWISKPTPKTPDRYVQPLEPRDLASNTLVQSMRANNHHPVFVRVFEGLAVVLNHYLKDTKIKIAHDEQTGITQISGVDEVLFNFYIAPAFNSNRRVNGADAPNFKVFLAETLNEKLDALNEVLKHNEQRKILKELHSKEITESLARGEQPLAPYIWFTKAPTGMLGLLASQLMNTTGHVAIVIGAGGLDLPDSEQGGSARAPKGFDVIDTLKNNGFWASGHQQACGVKAANLKELYRMFLVLQEADLAYQAAKPAVAAQADLILGPIAGSDQVVLNTVELEALVKEIKRFGPYGHGFEEPKIVLAIDPKTAEISTISQNKHIRITTSEGLKVLWWNSGDKYYNIMQSNDLIVKQVQLSINHWNSNSEVQAMVREQE